MKIKITEAMKMLHEDENFKGGYSNVQVKLHRDDQINEALSWQIYAYDAKSKNDSTAWSDNLPTFEEALQNLIEKFENGRTPIDPFVEN